MAVCRLFFTAGEEAVECRHHLRASAAEEFAQAVLAVLFAFFGVVRDCGGAICLVDPARSKG